MTEISKLKEYVYSTPLFLLNLTDSEDIEFINNLLPYSTGFEIECNQTEYYDVSLFKNIPDIIDVNNDSSEQRYRIPNGLVGMLCLYNICNQLKVNSSYSNSGIHYHIDMTNSFHLLTSENVGRNSEWILKELDIWGYKGNYNGRTCDLNRGDSVWIRFQKYFKTAEIRIGEMSFEYEVLIKRIIHANKIIRKLNSDIGYKSSGHYLKLDFNKVFNYIKTVNLYDQLLSNLTTQEEELLKIIGEDRKRDSELISGRIIKLY